MIASITQNASPVFRVSKTVKQSDGTSLLVTRVGADHLLYYITSDSVPVYPNKNNDFCYAQFDNQNNVVASEVIAHEAKMRTPYEKVLANDMADSFKNSVLMRKATRYGVGSLKSACVRNYGDVNIAVILAEFQDLSFQPENDIEKFDKHFNASNYTAEGGAGSVRDYFIAQSDSLFRPHFDIVAKVKVSQNYKYYGANSGGDDIRARAYIAEATDSAIMKGVDFSKYLNSEGELFVIVIYPGQGEQVSGENSQLWASYYYYMSHTVGKYKVTSGLVMDELADYGMGEMFDGIGTLCHEFSHALGMPDFYNTNGMRNIFGMDAWSIMDYGQYNNLGRTPVGYTAYERNFMEWLKIDTLKNEKQMVTLPPLHSKGKSRALCIPNESDKKGNEYYLLENRQASPWYMKLYGEGMLVTHVDYNANAWASNTINNSLSHPRMTIIPADNVLTPYSSKASDYKGDLFPGYKNVTEFGYNTTPLAKAYNGDYMNFIMKNIHEENDNIVFYYQCDGQLDSPEKLSTTDVSQNSVMLSFDTVRMAEKYIVQVMNNDVVLKTDTISDTKLLIDKLTADTYYTISVTAIATKYLDSYPSLINVTPSVYEKADVNEDGKINSADIVSIYNFIFHSESSGIKKYKADVNGDGVVNSTDITEVYNSIE